MSRIYPYLGALVIFSLIIWRVNDRAYNNGESAAQKVCASETVPAARLKEQEICKANSLITESNNAQNYQNQKAAADRATAQYDKLRKQYRATPCTPVTNLASVHNSGAGAVPTTAGSGVDARDLIDLAKRCQDRSDSFLGARKFILDTWGANK